MSRPWNKQTSATHLEPIVLGQFDDFDQWVSFAEQALTSITDNRGRPLKAICIDDIGRRCNIGADFMRARDENTFPVRYFTEMKERTLSEFAKLDIEVVAHRYVYKEPLNIRGQIQQVPQRGIVHGCEPMHHNGYPISDIEGLYGKGQVDKVIATLQTNLDEMQSGFRHLSAMAVEGKRISDAKLEFANKRIAELENQLAKKSQS